MSSYILIAEISFRKQIDALDKKIAVETDEAAKAELQKKRAAFRIFWKNYLSRKARLAVLLKRKTTGGVSDKR